VCFATRLKWAHFTDVNETPLSIQSCVSKFVHIPKGHTHLSSVMLQQTINNQKIKLRKWIMDYFFTNNNNNNNNNNKRETIISCIIKQICLGLCHMQDIGYIHSDLKPANVLIDIQNNVNQIRLIDFNISKPISRPFDVDNPPTTMTSAFIYTSICLATFH
jgi:serine/threonine protein kinase